MLSTVKSLAFDFFKKFTNLFGGILISKKVYNYLLDQRASAISLMAIQQELESGLTGIIFSKDRAIQLHALLVSFENFAINPPNLKVIYHASTLEHKNSYLELEKLLKKTDLNIEFIAEGLSFRNLLIFLLESIRVNKVFFLVDDIIFIRHLNFLDITQFNPANEIFSLRHSPHIDRSYTANKKSSLPRMSLINKDLGLYRFEWFEGINEWGDPWSVDGQILSTAEVLAIAKISSFKTPNSFEAALKSCNDIVRGRFGVCFSRSVILNIPLNRVQDEYQNISGDVSVEFLLGKWMDGYALNFPHLKDHIPISTHEEHSFNFIKRI